MTGLFGVPEFPLIKKMGGGSPLINCDYGPRFQGHNHFEFMFTDGYNFFKKLYLVNFR